MACRAGRGEEIRAGREGNRAGRRGAPQSAPFLLGPGEIPPRRTKSPTRIAGVQAQHLLQRLQALVYIHPPLRHSASSSSRLLAVLRSAPPPCCLCYFAAAAASRTSLAAQLQVHLAAADCRQYSAAVASCCCRSCSWPPLVDVAAGRRPPLAGTQPW